MSAWLKILTANKFKVLSIGTSNLLYYLQFYTIGCPPLSQSLQQPLRTLSTCRGPCPHCHCRRGRGRDI